jgi:MSHA biogenesis protein MshN
LPYAGSNPEYHAFLAGVLQREQRHAEAAQHYRDALQLTPQNGMWWMGLGISLQADQHPAEAREAYRRARAANGLSAELQAFVDRKLDACRASSLQAGLFAPDLLHAETQTCFILAECGTMA